MTGASRGIGRAAALRLAAEGALVAVHYGGKGPQGRWTAGQSIDVSGGAYLGPPATG